MFYDVYLSLCKKTGEKPYAVASLVGVKNNSSVASWQRGSVPRQPVLEAIAEHFGVTIDYLLTGEEKPAGFFKNLQIFGEQKQPSVPEGLSEKDQRLIAWFRSLPEEKQKAILILQGGPEDAL